MDQWGTCLPGKHEDQSLDLQNPLKSQAVWIHLQSQQSEADGNFLGQAG